MYDYCHIKNSSSLKKYLLFLLILVKMIQHIKITLKTIMCYFKIRPNFYSIYKICFFLLLIILCFLSAKEEFLLNHNISQSCRFIQSHYIYPFTIYFPYETLNPFWYITQCHTPSYHSHNSLT